MLVEPPQGVRGFLREYAMIVVSILTALLLEHVAVGIDAQGSARASRGRIEAELARNLSGVRDAEATDRADITAATGIMHSAIARLEAGELSGADAVPLLMPAFNHFGFALPTLESVSKRARNGHLARHSCASGALGPNGRSAPVLGKPHHLTIPDPFRDRLLQRSAWDAAIADRSASHLNPRDLVRYAEIYAQAQDAIDTECQLTSGDWFSTAAARSVSLHTKTPDVRGMVTMRVRYVIVVQQVERLNEALETAMAGRGK